MVGGEEELVLKGDGNERKRKPLNTAYVLILFSFVASLLLLLLISSLLY